MSGSPFRRGSARHLRIDTDFDSDRREEVFEYIKNKYGHDYFCHVGTYGSLQVRGAIKELARVHGVKGDNNVNVVTQLINSEDWTGIFNEAIANKKVKRFIVDNPKIINDTKTALHSIKSKGIHACATIIVPKGSTIYEQIPVRKEGDFLVSEWEGGYLEKAGYLKEDILATKQMAKIGRILDLIEKNHGLRIDLGTIDLEDDDVYNLFKQGRTQDVFQFGTKGLTNYMKHLQPDNIEDLIAATALYRPGPMASDAHNLYIKLKEGLIDPKYDYKLQKVTEKTYGLYIYQEQVMEAVKELGGFTLVEADGVRSAMGKKIKDKMDEYKAKFIQGSVKNLAAREMAEEIWDKLEVFSGYGFNRCISGDEKLLRQFINKTGKSCYHPTIKEMYEIKNNLTYAKLVSKTHLRRKYNSFGYGTCFSLKGDILIKNKIKDIRYEGVKPIYRMTLVNGKTIDVTDNHKFPTSNGEKMLKDIDIDQDKIYVNSGYFQEDWSFSFITGNKGKNGSNNIGHKWWDTTDRNLNSEKGKMGFQKRDGSYSSLKKYISETYKNTTTCQKCGGVHRRLEVHHINGNHTDNDHSNLTVFCPSCHKKAHYEMGRVKMGEKGLKTYLVSIHSIGFLKNDDVYDVEMEAPNHTFATANNIVTCNSHAAAYSLVGYWCNWLKHHYPLEFWTIAFQYAEDDNIQDYVGEIKRQGRIQIVEPNINKSGFEFYSDKDQQKIYWNLSQIKFVGDKAAQQIIGNRDKDGQFFDLEEFMERCANGPVNLRVVQQLIKAGAFDEIHHIHRPSERSRLMIKFFESRKEPCPQEYIDNCETDYWWSIQQQEVSKLSHLDYIKLIKGSNLSKHLKEYISGEEFNYTDDYDKTVLVVGTITEVALKRTKNNDPFFTMSLKQDDFTINLRGWKECLDGKDRRLDDLAQVVQDGKKCLVIVRGTLQFNDWSNQCEVLVSPRVRDEIFQHFS